MKRIDWYFDYISPFAYLQSQRLGDFAGAAEIRPVPVLFAGLLNATGTLGPAEIPAKRLWTYRFCQFTADRAGVPFRMPPAHPFNPLRVLRLSIALHGDLAAIDAIFRFVWGEGRDPVAEWPALTAALGVADADTLIAREAVKTALRENTEKAVAAGVYGVPTLMIDGQAFWGVDGTDFALAYLADPGILETGAMKRLETLPAAAERRR
ncbi:MAG: 2-hydroxychromene-2-carboxylate isomerase [Rhodospirillaceae bacterium]|nr:2-hydroxychromene-2-carboxylate isomerase [Rhodospirillaceae bacterium]MCY4064937.1 2-hydroxychromene-2-carboxylate isomerase [Rhodospirillaceae bacterium]